MREIKFRAWNPNKKEWLQPIGANLAFPYARAFGKPWDSRQVLFGFQSDNHVVWMQFTGLKDKNRKEIYEGDIISWPGEFTAKVFWCEEEPSFQIKTNNGGGAFLNQDYMNNFGIIGNIYENPELLR